MIGDGNTQHGTAIGAFFTFLVLGSLICILTFIGTLAWNVLQTDILRSNPHRSVEGAVGMIVPMGFAVGLLITIGDLSFALLVAGAIAAFAVRRLGRCPGWTLGITVPLCALAIYAQMKAPPHIFDQGGDPEFRYPDYRIVLNFMGHLCPALLVCWLWISRRRRRPALGPSSSR